MSDTDLKHRGISSFRWSDIKKHASRTDRWIVIDRKVYDVSNFQDKHPGGRRILGHYAGQDASEAFQAFHSDFSTVRKYMKVLYVGELHLEEDEDSPMVVEFRTLRDKLRHMGFFESKPWWFVLYLLHILTMMALSWVVLHTWGTSWTPYLVSLALISTAQAQSSWLQHDFGHLSVFHSSRLDLLMHNFIMGSLKGASPNWWRHMHNQHHAKPNVIDKDPDVRLENIFVVGEKMPKKVAREKQWSMPYNQQHRYFFIIGPPLLFPVYFQLMVFYFTITRKHYQDLMWMAVFYLYFLAVYAPLLGIGGCVCFFFAMRCIESHWFTWVSQSNHIPMEVDEDLERPWLALQIRATCDIEQSWFNDWFTGHLNFQIEHHCFPTMPRHNYYKAAPYVRALCNKYGIKYHTKALGSAFGDIIRSLKQSGKVWEEMYSQVWDARN